MNKIVYVGSLMFASLLFPIVLLAQVDTVFSDRRTPRTVIEEYTLKSSVFLKKEFLNIGSTNKLTIEVLQITNVSTGITISGIRFSWTDSNFSRTSFIDKDEIDDLSNSVFKMTTIFNQNPPINYTEYNFITKSGFEVGIFSQDKIKPWRAYVKNEYRYSKIFFNSDELWELQKLLQIAKSKL